MLHIVNVTKLPWPHHHDQGRPHLVHVAWFSKEEIPESLQWNVELGCYVIHDAAGYLCATEDPAELTKILAEEALQPGYTRKRLTGEVPEELRRQRMEDTTSGPLTLDDLDMEDL